MLSTKNVVERTNVPKLITPGKVLAKFTSIELEEDKLSRDKGGDGYFLVLNLEGVDLSEQGFEGFFIDPQDESKGRYKGQIGKVRCGSISKTGVLYSFSSNPDKNIDRDASILAFIKSYISIPLNRVAEIDNIEASTIEDYVRMLSKLLVDGEYYYFVIGGREWIKNGYTQYNLFLPKQGYKKDFAIGVNEEDLLKFDENTHIIKKKPAAEVDSFGSDNDKDFDL